jgi:hypothetical protein
MLLSTAAQAAAITTAATQASKKAFIRILRNLAWCTRPLLHFARTPHTTGEVTVRGRSRQPTTGADQWDDILEGWRR